MKMFSRIFLGAALVAAMSVFAQAEDLKPQPVLVGLLNPSGLAMQPGTDHLMVSDSGAGRIFGFSTDDWHADKVIIKFDIDKYGKGPIYDIGPLGLAFVGKRLVVGGGDQVDGKEVVYFFDLPPHGKTIEAKDAAFKTNPIKEGHKDSPKGEGNFYAIAHTNDAIYVTSNGDDTKGWVLKADIGKDGKPGELTPFIATKTKVEVDAPIAIVVDEHGHLVIGQGGEVNVAGDSLLTIYDAKSGELIAKAKTGLNDITGLAYGPKSKKLYAIDFSWVDPKAGGLYRLDLSGEEKDATVKTEKLCPLDKPAAMCFGADGALYVAEFGTVDESKKDEKGNVVRPGRVVKIEGDL
jgi:sugar lactone lactonase YvrE